MTHAEVPNYPEAPMEWPALENRAPRALTLNGTIKI
jgi:hypothetical protein